MSEVGTSIPIGTTYGKGNVFVNKFSGLHAKSGHNHIYIYIMIKIRQFKGQVCRGAVKSWGTGGSTRLAASLGIY